MRAFVGLPVPEPWIARLVRAQHGVPGGRKIVPDDLHVTLAFLDDQPEERLESLAEELTARALPEAELRAHGFDAMGGKEPRTLVLALAAGEGLTALRDAVRAAARAAGIDLARERFRPHVTLVRFPASRERFTTEGIHGLLTDMGRPNLQPARAGALTLWSSTLTPEGPIYEALQSWPLGARAA